MTKAQNTAHAPETVEGWYALHRAFRYSGRPRREGDDAKLGISAERRESYPDGWTGWVELIGSRADLMLIHFYPTLEERSRLMQSHGMTGRRYAGRVQQVITGAIGLDAWEWGVTLFAKDPIDFKKLVTDMRFDEVSATYADFGEFFVGKLIGTQ